MSNVMTSVSPGYYLEQQTFDLSFSNKVVGVSANMDGIPPSISKYIAYDTLNPPNPFIAVTEDGTGRVVYDGGFPKFYNGSAPTGIFAFRNALKINPATGGPGSFKIPIYSVEFGLNGASKLLYSYKTTGAGFAPTLVGYGLNGVEVFRKPVLISTTYNSWVSESFVMSEYAGQTITSICLEGSATTTSNVILYMKDISLLSPGLADQEILTSREYVPSVEVELTGSCTLAEHRNATSFDSLPASYKYYYNVLQWIANPLEVESGNRKILILGDATGGVSYKVKGRGGNDFQTSIEQMALHGNWDIVIKDSADYGGTLNPRTAELSQYVAVVFFSTVYTAGVWVTDAAVDDLVRFRENGGGLFFITDHGPIIGDINTAIAGTAGFFGTANRIATRFGAWFSGDYNRIPVNVGFIRNNYGEHPLYANMLDSENISAGGSESRVFVTSSPISTPTETTKRYTVKNAANNINVLLLLEDGSVETTVLRYYIVSWTLLLESNGKQYGSGTVIDVKGNDSLSVLAAPLGDITVPLVGQVFLNNVPFANISGGNGQPLVTTALPQFDLNRIPVNNNSAIYFRFTQPSNMELSFPVRRTVVRKTITGDLNSWAKYDEILEDNIGGFSAAGRLSSVLNFVNSIYDIKPLSVPKSIDYSKLHLDGPMGVLDPHFKLRIGYFDAPTRYYGFFRDASNGDGGTLTPLNHNGLSIRDMNSPLMTPLLLQFGLNVGTSTTVPSAVYLNNQGPFLFHSHSSSGAERYFYSDGVTDICGYLSSRVGQTIEIRFFY